MDRVEVVERLRTQMAEQLEMEPAEITEESRLVDDLDADSLDLLELILGLKERFGIAVNDGEVKQLLTELARFLPERVGAGGDTLSDAELAEVSRRLTVGSVVDFVVDRVGVDA